MNGLTYCVSARLTRAAGGCDTAGVEAGVDVGVDVGVEVEVDVGVGVDVAGETVAGVLFVGLSGWASIEALSVPSPPHAPSNAHAARLMTSERVFMMNWIECAVAASVYCRM
ncbi:hypothetical protein [Burkholderia alba]|uniref:hypothetical protein n=1 Tax=Burkholderia alba TaxID=2683677 RepID=UPI002B056985|nr:hypothetical protein [Burkholderia alba]